MKKTIKRITIITLALVAVSAAAVYANETRGEAQDRERFVHRIGIERQGRGERLCLREALEEIRVERPRRCSSRRGR